MEGVVAERNNCVNATEIIPFRNHTLDIKLCVDGTEILCTVDCGCIWTGVTKIMVLQKSGPRTEICSPGGVNITVLFENIVPLVSFELTRNGR